MGFLNFFSRNRKHKAELAKTRKPSPEQILFAETTVEIIGPTVGKFGFKRCRTEIEEYATSIIFRKNDQYIRIDSSTFPTDYPYYYNLILGEGDSKNFYEYDWNSITRWKLKSGLNKKENASEYKFPFGEAVKFSLENANSELLEYGLGFLNGDLNLFREVREKQNRNREPYKIHTPDGKGTLSSINELKSVEQKKKYS